MTKTNKFLSSLKKADARESISITENGAVGYARSGHALTDFFFKVGSMRKAGPIEIANAFAEVYAEDKQRALELMFFIRDCRGGQGEKHVFNAIFGWVVKNDPSAAISLLSLVPEYGSWKSFFELTPYFLSASEDVRKAANNLFMDQWDSDIDGMNADKSISLMAKWCPSANASSRDTKNLARYWRGVLGITEKEYRKTLSSLRDYLKVLETKMSANKWSEIDYNAVPSRAGVIYRNSFLKHDETRRRKWLEDLKKSESGAKINTGVLDCPTVVSKYKNDWYGTYADNEDATLEAAWVDMVKKGRESGVTGFIPVIDGSGSMTISVGDNLTALNVAHGLGLYFAAINAEPWRGKAIEFGSHPEFFEVDTDGSLLNQLKIAARHADCGTTNLEAVFDLVLKAAVDGNLKQEEIPGIIIFSDGEFNFMCNNPSERLMKGIANKWNAAGYKLPKLFFWNINSRTGTLPMIENDLGVGLISGFNQSIMKMVMSNEVNPYKIIIEQLDAPRYDLVRKALSK